MLKTFITFSITALLLFSCKKEKTNWDSNWAAPLVHGRLTLEDVIAPQYLATNSDNYLSIVYQESVYSFSVDTLIDLPDTLISKKTAVNFPTITVNPGFAYGDSYNQEYVLDQIELKRVIVKSGEIEMTIRSPWPGKTKLTFNFPKILEAGNPFIRDFYLDAGTQANPSVQSDIISMQGFDIDLTGVLGDLYNTISGDIYIESNEATLSYDITNSDSIEYDLGFKNLIPHYAKGYFGSYILTDTTGIKLPFMDKVIGGAIDLDSIDLNIIIKNGFNLVAQSKITLLEGYNSKTSNSTALNFPLLNTSININPASGGLYDYVPSEYSILVNNTNSNVAPFLENLSDSIVVGYELLINPFGNVTNGNDELFPGSTMDIFLDMEFPLSFGANDLTITDTFDISYESNSAYTAGDAQIVLDYENGFPIEAIPALYLLDGSGNLLDSIIGSSLIAAGTFNNTTYATVPKSGSVVFNLTASDIVTLENSSQMAFIVAFTTDNGQVIKINADAFIDFDLRTNLQISIHL